MVCITMYWMLLNSHWLDACFLDSKITLETITHKLKETDNIIKGGR